MEIYMRVNETLHEITIAPGDSLLKILRRLGYFGVKFGDEHGLSGADTVLLDGRPANAGLLLAAQAEGHAIQTIESIGQYPEQGWKTTEGLHPIQKAFVECGAIQCGYCTPAQVLAAYSLLRHTPAPSKADIREALSGILCRCTGYVKPVEAVLHAAESMRGEIPSSPTGQGNQPSAFPASDLESFPPASAGNLNKSDPFLVNTLTDTTTRIMPKVFVTGRRVLKDQ